ncbi:alpha/beta fold hydrolase [Rhizorhabdus argentea]|uniref:hypothetical protein n=1 Tax=Rhizorhabdus argentea TaxID=1387174 RepID=UPI0030EB3384
MLVQDQNYVGNSVQNPSFGWTSLSHVPDDVELRPVELSAEDRAPSRGLLYLPKGRKPKVGIHMMHPRADQSTNYNIIPLVRAGCAALGRSSRWPNNDSATTHEHLLLDMAAGIRRLKEAGCEKIVLVGNSGGGTLAAFYQEQASAAPGQRLRATPAGDPLDLNDFDLPVADGLAIIGGHIGQGGVMRKLIDAAVVDEGDPLATDARLDMYDARNGFVLPPASSHYGADFLARYDAAQAERVSRIDARALSLIERSHEAAALARKLGDGASLAQKRAAQIEQVMVIYRTTACPAFVDTGIEADGRNVMSYFTGKPHEENYRASGFARYITPRAWLSTWSVNYSKACTVRNLKNQTAPLLIVHYAGDCGTRLSEVEEMYAMAAASDKTLKIVEGIDHYGLKIMPDGQPGPRMWEGTAMVVDWVRDRFGID